MMRFTTVDPDSIIVEVSIDIESESAVVLVHWYIVSIRILAVRSAVSHGVARGEPEHR